MRPSKRDELVRKALAVFYRNGFHATGMDRLVAETGVSKTSIYKHFRSKDDLILAALRLRDEEFRNWMIRRTEALAAGPGDRLLAVFDALGEWFGDARFQSCMFIKAASEFQDQDHPVHRAAAEHKRLLRDYLKDLATAAGARNPQDLADQLQTLAEGAITMAHLNVTTDPAATARQAAALLVNEALKR